MKRIFAVFAVLALMAGMAIAAPSMYGSNGLFRTISAQNAGPMNYGIGVYAYGWKFDLDSTATTWKTGAMDMAIVPSGYFSINDMFEISFGTNFLMPSSYVEIAGTKTTYNPSGLGDSRVGLKFSYKLSDNFVGGIYAGYDIATLADTFKSSGVDYKGGIDARLLGDLKLGDGCLNINAGMYMAMDADSASGETFYPNMAIPFGLGFSYDLGMIAPYAEVSAMYLMDTNKYPDNAGTGTVSRGLLDNPTWVGGGVRLYFSGLNVTLGGEYNLLADSSANSPWFSDNEHWHAVLGLAYAPKAEVGPKVPPTASLTGKVTDAKGKGLAATVTAGGLTANTDPATGVYTLAGLAITKMPTEIKAVAKLYDSKSGSVILTKKNKKTPAIQDFALDLTPIPPSVITGNLIDYKTGKPVAAVLTFKDAKGKTITANADAKGAYTTKLEPGNYDVQIAAEGYNPKAFVLNAADGKPVSKNVALVMKKEVFIFNDINFASGKAIVTPEIEKSLQPLLKVLLDNPDVKVEIGGHTDGIGTSAKNLKLSQARADAVVAWLITNNVKATMTSRGYGEDKPIATNKTKAGRAQNRRIEINVVD